MVHFMGLPQATLLDPTHCPKFGTGFRLGNEGNLDSCSHESCSCISEFDVRIFKHQNWTSTTKVMVHLIPGIAIA